MKPPTRRPERPPPEPATLSDIRDGIAKLCQDIGSLQGEVNELSNLIGRFSKGRELRPYNWAAESNLEKGETASTPEPKSRIMEALDLLPNADTAQQQSLLLRAISRDLDGALRDIRVSKLDVRAIVDDDYLGGKLKDWSDDDGL